MHSSLNKCTYLKTLPHFIEGFKGSIDLKVGSIVYFVQGKNCWEKGPTSANSVHVVGTRLFGETKSKTMRVYAQSGQYHTTVEIHDSEQEQQRLMELTNSKFWYTNKIIVYVY